MLRIAFSCDPYWIRVADKIPGFRVSVIRFYTDPNPAMLMGMVSKNVRYQNSKNMIMIILATPTPKKIHKLSSDRRPELTLKMIKIVIRIRIRYSPKSGSINDIQTRNTETAEQSGRLELRSKL